MTLRFVLLLFLIALHQQCTYGLPSRNLRGRQLAQSEAVRLPRLPKCGKESALFRQLWDEFVPVFFPGKGEGDVSNEKEEGN